MNKRSIYLSVSGIICIFVGAIGKFPYLSLLGITLFALGLHNLKIQP